MPLSRLSDCTVCDACRKRQKRLAMRVSYRLFDGSWRVAYSFCQRCAEPYQRHWYVQLHLPTMDALVHSQSRA